MEIKELINKMEECKDCQSDRCPKHRCMNCNVEEILSCAIDNLKYYHNKAVNGWG